MNGPNHRWFFIVCGAAAIGMAAMPGCQDETTNNTPTGSTGSGTTTAGTTPTGTTPTGTTAGGAQTGVGTPSGGTPSGGAGGAGGSEPISTDTLVVSELVIAGAEYIEIFNGTGASIDLSNYYITDATYTDGSAYYYNLVTGSDAGGGSWGDFNAQFPAGSTIADQEYQTISLTGSTDFNSEYGFDPTYEMYEDAGSADSIPDMVEATAGSIDSVDEGSGNVASSLSNNGEVLIIYSWDGATDLVQDIDYVLWGDAAEAVSKTGVSIDGPDGGGQSTAYLDDTATGSQAVVATVPHEVGKSYSRIDFAEGSETATAGNGISGHDETSEDVNTTFAVDRDATPGARNAGL